MSELVRFGVSIPRDLIEPFDKQIEKDSYTNRSEAIRDLIRDYLVREEEKQSREMFGTFTFVYDHHTPGLDSRLTDVQHEYAERVVSTLHVHIDHHNCLQVLILHGNSMELRELATRLKALRGVKHATLSLTTGKHLV
jgi:CopG family nickel-responsive transcriptional regulator